jgi:AraC-like DNA-binding protein
VSFVPPLRFTVYYGARRFLLAAPHFVLDRAKDPYRRLSATVLIACRAPFQLEIGDDPPLTAQVALIAPKVPRRRLIAVDSDVVIFDIPIQSPEFLALAPLMRAAPVQVFDAARVDELRPALLRTLGGGASCAEVGALFTAVARSLSGIEPRPRALDPRIEKAMQLIATLPLAEVELAQLAGRLHLSPSRLRHLFKDELGSTVSHYARWLAVWRAVALWTQGKALTQIAHEVGFYDLAHLDHAFVELFGLNPSTIIDHRNVTLIKCTDGV